MNGIHSFRGDGTNTLAETLPHTDTLLDNHPFYWHLIVIYADVTKACSLPIVEGP